MMPEDREPNAPDMPHAHANTRCHTHTSSRPYRRRAFRQGTLRQRQSAQRQAAGRRPRGRSQQTAGARGELGDRGQVPKRRGPAQTRAGRSRSRSQGRHMVGHERPGIPQELAVGH
eukprot:scaffold18151_cov112-Isochrysis_galbana.AAC.1